MTEQTKIVFLDLETTGLSPHNSSIWEMAALFTTVNDDAITIIGEFETMFLPTRFDPFWLESSFKQDFDERFNPKKALQPETQLTALIEAIHNVNTSSGLADAGPWHLAGMCPWFDDAHLKTCTEAVNMPWHYHLIDVETQIAGKFGIHPPYKSEDLSMLLGVNPQDFHRHTAMGDTKWAIELYRELHGLTYRLPKD